MRQGPYVRRPITNFRIVQVAIRQVTIAVNPIAYPSGFRARRTPFSRKRLLVNTLFDGRLRFLGDRYHHPCRYEQEWPQRVPHRSDSIHVPRGSVESCDYDHEEERKTYCRWN